MLGSLAARAPACGSRMSELRLAACPVRRCLLWRHQQLQSSQLAAAKRHTRAPPPRDRAEVAAAAAAEGGQSNVRQLLDVCAFLSHNPALCTPQAAPPPVAAGVRHAAACHAHRPARTLPRAASHKHDHDLNRLTNVDASEMQSDPGDLGRWAAAIWVRVWQHGACLEARWTCAAARLPVVPCRPAQPSCPAAASTRLIIIRTGWRRE